MLARVSASAVSHGARVPRVSMFRFGKILNSRGEPESERGRMLLRFGGPPRRRLVNYLVTATFTVSLVAAEGLWARVAVVTVAHC